MQSHLTDFADMRSAYPGRISRGFFSDTLMPNIPELTSIERRFYELNGELHCRAHQRWHCRYCFERAKASENTKLILEPVEKPPAVRPSLWALFIAVVTAVTLAGYFN